MDKIFAYIGAHQLAFGYFLSTAITILVSPLPKPDLTSTKFYSYFYGVSQAIAGVVHVRPAQYAPIGSEIHTASANVTETTITPAKPGWINPV